MVNGILRGTLHRGMQHFDPEAGVVFVASRSDRYTADPDQSLKQIFARYPSPVI